MLALITYSYKGMPSYNAFTSVTNFCSGLSRSGEQELSRLPVESVDFLGAGVAKQER